MTGWNVAINVVLFSGLGFIAGHDYWVKSILVFAIAVGININSYIAGKKGV